MAKNPYTRLKDEADAKIASLTEQHRDAVRSANAAELELSKARQRIIALEHCLSLARLLNHTALDAATYLARSWFTGGKGRATEQSLLDASDIFSEAFAQTQPKSGVGLFAAAYDQSTSAQQRASQFNQAMADRNSTPPNVPKQTKE